MLKMTKIEFDFIPDPDMYILFEKGTRSGISYISNRYSKANNKNLKSYDIKQESKHIIYLDANNLYGYAMAIFRPTNGFKWIEPKEIDLNKYAGNSSKGCVVEDDLEYPKKLGELHNNYPLAPDETEIKREMLSWYQKRLLICTIFLLVMLKHECLTFLIKENMCFIMKTCNFTLTLALTLRKIHPVLEFNQSQKSAKFHCLVLMTKCISKTKDIILELIIKNTVMLIAILKKAFLSSIFFLVKTGLLSSILF